MSTLYGLDRLNLVDLKIALARHIKQANDSGTTMRSMAARNDHVRGFMHITNKDPVNWSWSTLYGLADGVGLKAAIEFRDLPEIETPLLVMGRRMPVFLGVGALEYLQASREYLGVSTREMGRRLGVVKSAVFKSENADDPKLHTIMRYSRALGGRAIYRLEDK